MSIPPLCKPLAQALLTPGQPAGHLMEVVSFSAKQSPPTRRAMRNSTKTTVTEFVLLGFPELCHLQGLLFESFLTIYVVTILENLVIVVTVRASHQLHTPMYFFLANLSVLETFYTSVTVPKLLAGLLALGRTISFSGCLTQLFLVLSLSSSECFLRATMACDWYLAICRLLHYPAIMDLRLCLHLALSAWLSGFLASFVSVALISRLRFCGPNVLNNDFCDISPLLQLSCSDTTTVEVSDFVAALAVLSTSLLVTMVSYGHILATVLRIPGGASHQKGFPTCASNLVVVAILCTTTIFMYAQPHAISSFDLNKLVSVVYSVVTPLLNPIIYCLQNRDIREALARLLRAPGPS
ncbi:LOW QUALITY PROTEIN: olfactory receptor 6B1-like [Diceros bicornis minor]|uniref:LOW QUALITY PROTEIN: olfactory receptor 6B1-like n=1 Tax=Diceros bicornis minor TaxID=77932 RepID=UPI0026EE54E3|nr:LOW QUALITY PROTEIN: olfactory receptor 6B1-like [Diceros bicornis minor]